MIKVLLIVRTDLGLVLGVSNGGYDEPLQFDYDAITGENISVLAHRKLCAIIGHYVDRRDILMISSDWSDIYECHAMVFAYKHPVECPPCGQPFRWCDLHGDQALIRRAFFGINPFGST